MGDEERWNKVRMIVREECQAITERILEVLARHEVKENKTKVSLVNGEWTGVTEQLKKAWSLAYPAVDIDQEMNRAAAWIMSNPQQAPTRQFSRFLLTWFSRTQDRLSIRSIPTRNEKPGPGKKLCAYCIKVATGSPNGTWACDDHFRNAMDHDPIPRMKGVPAKAVAGE